MKKLSVLLGLLFFVNLISFAQESGNRIYGNQGYYNQTRRQPTTNTGGLTNGSFVFYSIEASVLTNMKPDSFVAVFGVNEEAPTAAVSNDKVNARIAALTVSLSNLGVVKNDIFVDFITQNRVYDYTSQGNSVTEKLSGFETKKTIAVRYKSRDSFEKIVAAAAKEQIFDLIKVDYAVSDFEAIRARMFDEAVKVIKSKEAKYTSSFGVKLAPIGLASEKYDAFYPGEAYQRYQAYESGDASTSYNNGTKVTERKNFTFYYEPLSVDRFDKVLSPIGIEPIVQFTLYLRMDYDAEKVKDK